MPEIITRVPLAQKEGEAIMWCLGQIANYPDREVYSETDPLGVLLNEGFARDEIINTANAMFDIAYGDWISDPMTALQKTILRVSVENTTWIGEYLITLPHMIGEAKAALRSLATKLDAFDIHVNHIPAD